ncbi:MAG TPA: MFS transporter [Roseomonas sp.]|jgi:MFS family permease
MSGRYRFVIAALLFFAGTINYMDRAAIGLLAPFMQSDLGIDAAQMGIVFSTFFMGYALFSFVGGYFSDRSGPRKTYAVAGAAWSIFCGLTGVVTGFWQLLIVRVLFGFAEGPMASTTNRTCSSWFPKSEAARAVGVTFSGQTLGSAIAAPLVIGAYAAFGWRAAFLALTVLGLIWAVLWMVFAADTPEESRHTSAAEVAYIRAGQPAAPKAPADGGVPLMACIKRPSVLALGAALFGINYTLYIFISWMPTYLHDVMGVDMKQMAVAAMLPWIGGFVGYIGGGWLADIVYRRSADKLAARKMFIVTPMLIVCVCLVALLFVSGVGQAVALLSVALLTMTLATQAVWASVSEVVPFYRVGGAGGFIHFLANLSGVLSPAITGFVVQYLGGYNAAFLLAAVIGVVAALVVVGFVKQPRAETPGLQGGAVARG